MSVSKINIVYLIAFVSLSIFGCDGKKQIESMVSYGPKTVEAKGYIIPLSSQLPPHIIAVKGVKNISAGKPKVIQLRSNITPVGNPSIIKLGTPTSVCILGQGPYKLPKVVPVIDSSFIVGYPEIVEVNQAQIIDFGTASFSSFNALQGLKNNIIFSIIQDKTGNIWIGSWGGGVAKYNGKSFTHYSTIQGLSSDMVYKIIEDRNGNLWFGTANGGVNKYDGKSLTIFTKKQGLCGNTVTDILEDKNGNIWICTYQGVSKCDGKCFTNYTDDLGIGIQFNRIIQDKSGNVWFKTDVGFCKYDGSSFTNYSVPEASWEDLKTSILNNKYDGVSFEKLSLYDATNIYKSERGFIWYASNKGIYKYDDNNCIQLGLNKGLNGANLGELLEDKNGNLWIGSNGGGIARSNGLLFTHIRTAQGLSSESIRSIFADRNGNIWVGTWGGGVNKLNGESISQYTTAQGLSSNNITAIYEDKIGNIWFGTWGNGVDKFDGEKFTNYSVAQGLTNSYIATILEDRKGNMWFGTSGDGVIKYDGASFIELNTSSLNGSDVISVLEDKNDNIWFGTIGKGLIKYDGKLFTHFNTTNGLNDMTVHSMLEDKYGNIWFGTANGGVNKYDGKIFTQYTVDQGLANNNVNSILEDKAGNIWFGTPNGLSKMNLSNEANSNSQSDKIKDSRTSLFKNYLFSDGFLGVGTWYNSLIQDKNGIIWAGTTDRITAYHPEEDFSDTIPPHIQLSGISLFNEDINWLKVEKNRDTVMLLKNGTKIKNFNFSNISKWNFVPEQLELINSNNFITFKFIGITTNKPERIKYQFMLEGLDETWSLVTANPEATYTNLSHGAYTFKVKAVNSEGYWSTELRYPFEINPPWWLSWWAYSIYALIFIFGVRIVHVFQKQRVIRQEREKAQKRELEQAKEIEKAYTKLQATQSQLIQAEKMASLGELTAGIAHEIQNPLNFMNNFSEVNTELIEEMKQELEMGNMEEVKSIVEDIAGNEKKIAQHGKRADSIVKGMLLHSRSSSGIKEPTDINKLADEFLRLTYHGVKAKDKSFNATMKSEFDPSIGKINVSAQEMGRVLLNLFNNAFYAVNEKSKLNGNGYEPTVSVSTQKLDDKVEIKVSDNGNGIPKALLDKIFQPFFTTKPSGEGTGLGLSLSYDIVTKGHNGELKVDTKEGEYTTFIIDLPV